jgi:hypothetical protein
MAQLGSSLWLLLTFVCCEAWADATTVYRVVDDRGVVGFSDTPPLDGSAAEIMQVSVPKGSAGDSLQQLEAMRQTTDRMALDRQEREAQRELVRLRAAAEADAQRQQVVPERVRYEYIYLPTPVAAPWHPVYHRPPHRPGVHKDPSPQGIISGPNSQLMRPILSRPRN